MYAEAKTLHSEGLGNDNEQKNRYDDLTNNGQVFDSQIDVCTKKEFELPTYFAFDKRLPEHAYKLISCTPAGFTENIHNRTQTN